MIMLLLDDDDDVVVVVGYASDIVCPFVLYSIVSCCFVLRLSFIRIRDVVTCVVLTVRGWCEHGNCCSLTLSVCG